MNTRRMIRCSIAALALIFVIASAPGQAKAGGWNKDKHHFNIRTAFLTSMPVGASAADGFYYGNITCCGYVCIPIYVVVDIEAEAENSMGFMLGLEWLFKDGRIGAEVDGYYMLGFLGYKGKFNGYPFSGEVNGYMLTAGLNYHFRPHGKLDFYAGPLFAPGISSKGKNDEIESDEGVAFGGNIGADYHMNKRLSFSANLRYIDFGVIDISWTAGESSSGGACSSFQFADIISEADLNFMMLSFGANLKF